MDFSLPGTPKPATGGRAYCIIWMIISIIAVMLRFWSRALSSSPYSPRFWWDDWCALIALVLHSHALRCIVLTFLQIVSLAQGSLELAIISLGLGKHISLLPLENTEQLLKALWIGEILFDTGMTFARYSVILFYSRIFVTRQKTKFRYVLWTLHALNTAWLIACIFATIFGCTPVEHFWNRTSPGFCILTQHLWLGSASTAFFLDLADLVVPIPMLWRLHLRPPVKAFIAIVLVIGSAVVIVSLGRLIDTIVNGKALDGDVTYYGVQLLYWPMSETPVAILCICLPSIFFLFRRAVQQGPRALFSRTKGSSRSSKNGFLADSRFISHSMGRKPLYEQPLEDSSAIQMSATDARNTSADNVLPTSLEFHRVDDRESRRNYTAVARKGTSAETMKGSMEEGGEVPHSSKIFVRTDVDVHHERGERVQGQLNSH